MRESSPSYFIGLDIGTTSVRCVIGSVDSTSEDPKLAVVGYGTAQNTGMRKGLIVHLEEVAGVIHAAVSDAERLSGIRIENATVNINGAHIMGADSKGVIAISTANKEITYEDKARAEEAATIVHLPSNREIIQVFPKNYQVDGQDVIKDPVGMHGVRLEVEAHIITAASPSIRILETAMDKAGVYPTHRTLTSLACAEMVLSRKQKEAGALVLDIGATTTNLAVIEDGEIQHVAVIPMGGTNVTNDLAIGLQVDLDIAEKVKIKHASLSGQGKEGKLSVDQDKKNYVFESDDINMIVEARMEEIFDFIDKELKKIHKSRKLPGGVVIVGGTAKIPGIDQFAREKLGLAARVGSAKEVSGIIDDIQDISFIPVLGLMHLDMIFADQSFSSQGVGARNSSPSNFGGLAKGIWDKIKP